MHHRNIHFSIDSIPKRPGCIAAAKHVTHFNLTGKKCHCYHQMSLLSPLSLCTHSWMQKFLALTDEEGGDGMCVHQI